MATRDNYLLNVRDRRDG